MISPDCAVRFWGHDDDDAIRRGSAAGKWSRGVGPILLAANPWLAQQMRPRAVVVLLVGTQNMTQMTKDFPFTRPVQRVGSILPQSVLGGIAPLLCPEYPLISDNHNRRRR